jgi:hypothetical protein
VPDLSPEEAETLRRSIATLPPQSPSGLSRERALAILGQLASGAEGAAEAVGPYLCATGLNRSDGWVREWQP